MRKLSEEQRQFYENARGMTKKQIDDIRAEIERELAAVKERITKLNGEMRPLRQIYEGACQVLGIKSDLEAEEKTNEDAEEHADVESSGDEYGLEDELIEVDDDEELEY